MTHNEIVAKINAFRAGQLGVNLVVTTLQDSKLAAAHKDCKGRLKKVTLINNVRLGTKYESRVEKRADENAEWKNEPLRGMEWVQYPYIKRSLGSGKLYLSICYASNDKATKFESEYLLDGAPITKDDAEDMFKPSCRSSKVSQKQLAAGIAEAEQIKVVQYCIDDIVILNDEKEVAVETYKSLIK